MADDKKSLEPVYLLWGEDREAVSRNLRNLLARVDADGGMPPERFRAEEHPADDVVAICQALSMGGVQLVVVEDVSDYKAADITPLVEYLASPNPGTCLALTSGPKPSPKLLEAASSAGMVAQFGPDPSAKGRERQAWLAQHAAKELERLGATAEKAAVSELVSRVAVDRPDAHKGGVNALELTRAAGLLADYAGGETISAAMVREMVPTHPDARAYVLADMLVRGDSGAAHDLLADLASGSDPADPMMIHRALARHFQGLAAAQRLGPRPSQKQVEGATGIKGYPAKKIAEQAGRLAPGAAERVVARLASLELDLRASSLTRLGKTPDDGRRFVLERATRDLLALTG